MYSRYLLPRMKNIQTLKRKQIIHTFFEFTPASAYRLVKCKSIYQSYKLPAKTETPFTLFKNNFELRVYVSYLLDNANMMR